MYCFPNQNYRPYIIVIWVITVLSKDKQGYLKNNLNPLLLMCNNYWYPLQKAHLTSSLLTVIRYFSSLTPKRT